MGETRNGYVSDENVSDEIVKDDTEQEDAIENNEHAECNDEDSENEEGVVLPLISQRYYFFLIYLAGIWVNLKMYLYLQHF